MRSLKEAAFSYLIAAMQEQAIEMIEEIQEDQVVWIEKKQYS